MAEGVSKSELLYSADLDATKSALSRYPVLYRRSHTCSAPDFMLRHDDVNLVQRKKKSRVASKEINSGRLGAFPESRESGVGMHGTKCSVISTPRTNSPPTEFDLYKSVLHFFSLFFSHEDWNIQTIASIHVSTAPELHMYPHRD